MLKKREHHVYSGLSTVPVVFSIVLQFFPVVDFNAALKKIKVFYLLAARGIAMGGISVYIPPKISNRFVHVWDVNTCFEIAMTS